MRKREQDGCVENKSLPVSQNVRRVHGGQVGCRANAQGVRCRGKRQKASKKAEGQEAEGSVTCGSLAARETVRVVPRRTHLEQMALYQRGDWQ